MARAALPPVETLPDRQFVVVLADVDLFTVPGLAGRQAGRCADTCVEASPSGRAQQVEPLRGDVEGSASTAPAMLADRSCVRRDGSVPGGRRPGCLARRRPELAPLRGAVLAAHLGLHHPDESGSDARRA